MREGLVICINHFDMALGKWVVVLTFHHSDANFKSAVTL